MRARLFSLIAMLGLGVSALQGQATPTATRTFGIQVGAGFSAIKVDDGNETAKGIFIYGDADFFKHLGLEGEFRYANLWTPADIGQTNYLIGPRVYFHHGRFMPYGKFLVGRGVINFESGTYQPSYSDASWMYSFGGGVDYRATRRLSVRVFDFEYQEWPQFHPNGLTPYGYSFGAAYRF